jgi:5-deoxy-glucuronate isomerase
MIPTEAEKEMYAWRVQSPVEEGMHRVIAPEQNDCSVSNIYRLNLPALKKYQLETGKMEMSVNLVKGKAILIHPVLGTVEMSKLDSFYLPGGECAELTAQEDCIFYIGAAICEGYGKPFFRKFNSDLPIGNIHQIHGEGAGQREVMFTLCPEDAASRLLCGFTWGGQGAWTSWPPHQHEKDLEEVYCYFDMDGSETGFHISYLQSGMAGGAVAHPVNSGTMVMAPRGYHPTVATPGTRNTYLWILTAFSHPSRRYDLAVSDPLYVG